MTRRVALLVFLFASMLAVACGRSVDNSQFAQPIHTLVSSTPSWAGSGALEKRLWVIERAFYEMRGYMPAWVDGDRTTPQWQDLVSQLHYAEKHGLDPQTYQVSAFEQAATDSRLPVDRVPELDARMTLAYLRYAADLLGWEARPKAIFPQWLVTPKKDDLAARLADAVAKGEVRSSLEALAPQHPQYKGLQTALAEELKAPTGHVDQLKMNLARWRWMPRDLGDRYILINVPSYQLQVMEGDTPTLAMRVIVGKPDTPTPLFSDRMTYVVFSPYWNIPSDIMKAESLPHVKDDPDWLQRNHMEVVDAKGDVVNASAVDWDDEGALKALRFRQTPGPENALGLVKFIFPNHFDVYLHDTNTPQLFHRDVRALSHGCIRVENPVALAEYVMRDRPEWTADRISLAMNTPKEQTVTLKTPLPVHIGYWTAWVQPDGKTVTYTPDPYGIDARQRQAIDR